MANRRHPQTEPVLDNSAAVQNPDTESSRIVHYLGPAAFKRVIGHIKSCEMTTVSQIRHITFNRLKELGVSRDVSEAYSGKVEVPLCFDLMTILDWIKGISPDDTKSVGQLVVIDATCVSRGG